MKSGEGWVTLHKAVLRLTLNGMEESAALNALSIAMHNGEIASRPVQSNGSKTSWEATEMEELKSADFENWMNNSRGMKPENKGGRPADPRWPDFYIEIIRIANQPDGLPEVHERLIEMMRDWAEKNWGKTLSNTTLQNRISDIYRALKKGH